MPVSVQRRSVAAAALAVLLVGGTFGSAAAATPVMDAQLNVDFVGELATPNVIDTVAVAGSHAYVTDGSAFYTIDISNPAAPSVSGQVATNTDTFQTVIAGKYAYLATDGAGLLIIDISNPAAPVQVGHFGVSGWTVGVAVKGAYAYVTEAPFISGSSALHVVDVTNPAAPTEVSAIALSGAPGKISISGNYAYLGAGVNLNIFSLSTPAAPALVGTYGIPATEVQVVQNTAYVIGGDAPGWLTTLDVSNPAAPTLIGSMSELRDPQSLAVCGNYVYVADWDFGLQVLDVTYKSHPILVGRWDQSTSWMKDVALGGSNIYAAQGLSTPNGGLRVLHLKPLINTITPPIRLYAHAGGALDSNAPTATTAQQEDTLGTLNFSTGNPWRPAFPQWGTDFITADELLNNLTDLHVWIGLQTAADLGTKLDVRAEVYRDGVFLLTTGEKHCVGGLTANANQAQEVVVPFNYFDRLKLSASAHDTISVTLYTRIGTTPSGAMCGSHSTASGMRIYFGSTTRPSRFGYQLSVITPRP